MFEGLNLVIINVTALHQSSFLINTFYHSKDITMIWYVASSVTRVIKAHEHYLSVLCVHFTS